MLDSYSRTKPYIGKIHPLPSKTLWLLPCNLGINYVNWIQKDILPHFWILISTPSMEVWNMDLKKRTKHAHTCELARKDRHNNVAQWTGIFFSISESIGRLKLCRSSEVITSKSGNFVAIADGMIVLFAIAICFSITEFVSENKCKT